MWKTDFRGAFGRAKRRRPGALEGQNPGEKLLFGPKKQKRSARLWKTGARKRFFRSVCESPAVFRKPSENSFRQVRAPGARRRPLSVARNFKKYGAFSAGFCFSADRTKGAGEKSLGKIRAFSTRFSTTVWKSVEKLLKTWGKEKVGSGKLEGNFETP